MGWDGFPKVDRSGRARTATQVLREELHPLAAAVKVQMKAGVGYGYVANPSADGYVRAWFYLVEAVRPDPRDDAVWFDFKYIPVDESPMEWPNEVVEAVTRWD